jgi:DNA-binding NarL/FixJ family response regulator
VRLATLADADMSPAPPDGAIRVLIADDDPLLRAGLRMMLVSAADVDVVAEAEDGNQVLALVDRYAPDVVLMDIRMPVMDGLAATEAVRSRPGAPEVVILTTFDADEHVLRALRAGAAGFVLKDTPPHDILAALRRVVRGEPVLSPAVTRRLIARAAGSAQDASRRRAREQLARLTERERQIAAEVGAGKSNMEISTALFLSVPTVKKHVSRILTTLNLNNRVQIALLVHDADLAPGGGPLTMRG